jgi:lipooligosaccharide transport system ATP-binding protein
MTAHADGPTTLAKAEGLVKRFGSFTAVDGIDFEVRRGEAFGFLGPNGAGKTSAMRMLGCTSPVTEGQLEVFGLDPATDGRAIRARLGVVSQEDNLDTDLTVGENLSIYGRYFGLPKAEVADRVAELLDFAQLSDRIDDRVDPLSGGMKRRLVIARGLINRPELLLLDEPTTGLDPQARHLLWERLWRLKSDGVSLVLTTHYMDEAEQLCDRLVVMDNGKIVDEGSPAELITRHCTREVVEVRYADRPAQDIGAEELGATGLRTEALADRLLVYADDGDAVVAHVHSNGHGLVDGGIDQAGHAENPRASVITSVLVRRASLEDVFLTLTGRSLDDG